MLHLPASHERIARLSPRPSVLVIEDDTHFAHETKRALVKAGYQVEVAETAEQGLTLAQEQSFNVVVTYLRLAGRSDPTSEEGLDIIRKLYNSNPRLPVILMTAYHRAGHAIEAIKFGAYDYILKDFEMTGLIRVVEKAVAAGRVTSEPLKLGVAVSAEDALIGKSEAMQSIYKEIGRVAATPAPVLICGERGTGKELVARALHEYSDRGEQPFAVIDCEGINDAQLERRLCECEGGTLFLTEIARVSPYIQSLVLRRYMRTPQRSEEHTSELQSR